jgi:3-hydroxyisobutyrate dehydrogenase
MARSGRRGQPDEAGRERLHVGSDRSAAEALELADRLGIEPAKLEEAIEGGPLDAPIADAKLHKMEQGDYAPEFPLQWALKDVNLAIQAAGDGPLPLLAALSQQWRTAVRQGHGRDDISAARLALASRSQG